MNEIPEELENALKPLKLQEWHIISTNAHKGRYNLSGQTRTGQKVFIKWNEDDGQGSLNLQKEIKVYHLLKEAEFIPQTFFSCDHLLAAEYIEEGSTLREFLLRNDNKEIFGEIIRTVLSHYRDFILQINTVNIGGGGNT